MMCFFVLSFFPRDVLDEVWILIESVSEGFLTYSVINIRDILVHAKLNLDLRDDERTGNQSLVVTKCDSRES